MVVLWEKKNLEFKLQGSQEKAKDHSQAISVDIVEKWVIGIKWHKYRKNDCPSFIGG